MTRRSPLALAALALLAAAGCRGAPAGPLPPERASAPLAPVASASILDGMTALDVRRDAVFARLRDDGQSEIAEATSDGGVRRLVAVEGVVPWLASRADDDLAFVVAGRDYLRPPETSDRLLRFDGSSVTDLGDRLLSALPTERDVLLAIGPIDVDEAGRVVALVWPRRDADGYYPGHFLCALGPAGDSCERATALDGGAWQLVADRAFTYARVGPRVYRTVAGADAWEELDVPDVADLVALSDGGVAVVEQPYFPGPGRPPAGILHVFAADGTEVRRLEDFGALVGHRIAGGWELREDYELVAEPGGWSRHTTYRRAWTQLIVRHLGGEVTEVGHHDGGYGAALVLPDGALRIEADDAVFVLPRPTPD